MFLGLEPATFCRHFSVPETFFAVIAVSSCPEQAEPQLIFTSPESPADLLQSVQAILSTSIEGAGASAGAATTPSTAASLGGDSEPEAAAKVRADLAATSLSSYFAPTARTRLARGERMQVRARRRLLTTGAVAYLLDWEPVAAGDS